MEQQSNIKIFMDETGKDINKGVSIFDGISVPVSAYELPQIIQSRDTLTRLDLHGPVFKVKEKAFRAAQALGVSKNGKLI